MYTTGWKLSVEDPTDSHHWDEQQPEMIEEFDEWGQAKAWLLSELNFLAADLSDHECGDAALKAADTLASQYSAARYLEYVVGEYTYYIEREGQPGC